MHNFLDISCLNDLLINFMTYAHTWNHSIGFRVCIPDGSVPAQWEDVTDSTPLTIMDDTATFSTPTSAR